MVVRIYTFAAANSTVGVALMGPIAVLAEARLAGVARGDVGGAVAEDVGAVVVETPRRGAQPACCGCWH